MTSAQFLSSQAALETKLADQQARYATTPWEEIEALQAEGEAIRAEMGRLYDEYHGGLAARAGLPVPPTTTCIEHAYGATTRLSFQIKVF